MSARRALAHAVLLAACLVEPGAAAAGPAAPARPRPTTVLVTARQTFLRQQPSSRSLHTAVVVRGARLVHDGRVGGPGCHPGWYRIAGGGYLCADDGAPSDQAPGGPVLPELPAGQVVPYQYLGVGAEGSAEYLSPSDAASDYFLRELAPRHHVAVVRRVRHGGEWFWVTTRGTYVPASEVYPHRPSTFSGATLGPELRLPLGFVVSARATVYREPGKATRQVVRRYERFTVLGSVQRRTVTYHQVGPQRYLAGRDVRLATVAPLPPGVGPQERWVDIDVREQVLVVYEGSTPRFATLVSTGRHTPTPLGNHRVWAKVASTDMKARPGDDQPYHMWEVPWTVFFKGSYGLHGTYWHDRFGERRSSGCVNLSPRDARTVFALVEPELPPGYFARLPRDPKVGTLIRVRDGRRLPVPPRPAPAPRPRPAPARPRAAG
jgi:lipoprotein-anchoring transpeptidase ErfK/SrfK